MASFNVESRLLSFCFPSPNGPLIYEEINPLRLKRSNRSMGAMHALDGVDALTMRPCVGRGVEGRATGDFAESFHLIAC